MFKDIIILLCFVSFAWTCTPWDGLESTGWLQVWTGSNFTGQFNEYRSSRRVCDNTGVGRRSVRSASWQYECKIYSEINCGGRETWTDAHGFANTPFVVNSFSCPWHCW